MKYIEITRTKKAEDTYLKRARSIMHSIPNEFAKNPETGMHPTEIVEWLKLKAPTLRKNSYRQYRASLAFHFRSQLQQQTSEETTKDYEKALKMLKEIPAELAAARKSIPDKTSSAKVKRLQEEDIPKLVQAMYFDTRSEWNRRAFDFLIAGMGCGLRPAEWENTQLFENKDDSGKTLIVENAKATNGRAGCAFREIPVPNEWIGQTVIRHIESVHEFAQKNPFEKYLAACRIALNRAVRKIWPNNPRKHYSLYSGRHQYCANLKVSRKTLGEIALLMGHASMETATQHYGRRICGYSRFAPPKNDSLVPPPRAISKPTSPTTDYSTQDRTAPKGAIAPVQAIPNLQITTTTKTPINPNNPPINPFRRQEPAPAKGKMPPGFIQMVDDL